MHRCELAAECCVCNVALCPYPIWDDEDDYHHNEEDEDV